MINSLTRRNFLIGSVKLAALTAVAVVVPKFAWARERYIVVEEFQITVYGPPTQPMLDFELGQIVTLRDLVHPCEIAEVKLTEFMSGPIGWLDWCLEHGFVKPYLGSS